MTSNEIRQKFLSFFEKHGHAVIPSASLIPENDPSVLFTTAGMHPLVPYLLGEKHPLGSRLTDVQKCVRTGDIDEVGDYAHHTFFEMLGNWSLGDYFKKEVIEWSYEFLTSPDYLGLDKNRIAVSVFAGDADAPFDQEAYDAWKNLGISEKRIAKLPKKNNWWGPAGEAGPCGPDTEMFYWVGSPEEVPESFNDDNVLWLEIWNDVFMQYDKSKEGVFTELAQKNIDTGMGLERTLAVVNGLDDNYKTELFWPIIEKIESLSGKKYDDDKKAMRIIADHIKASVFILGDNMGIAPSNSGQGYVLRRLIRRAVRYGKQLGMASFTGDVAKVVIDIYKDVYPELIKNQDFVLNNLSQEEEKFEKTLEKGLKEFEKGINPFVLFTTYGFPFEMTKELAMEKGVEINEEEFNNEFKKHQELSQTSSAGMFKGGLSDSGEETKKLHTATHLLRQALENVLGETIVQKGSNINAERLRFDFAFSRKLTDEEKQKAEDLVNEKIKEALPVVRIELPKEEAIQTGAVHSFSDKYGDIVSVYYIGDSIETAFSKEFCGGPHVSNTNELGKFKIAKEEAVSAGVRRIKAVLE
ncbi:MAG: alanine--tRNA ligase [bacterium]